MALQQQLLLLLLLLGHQVAGPTSDTCSTGLTISGSANAALNADYYADSFSKCGAESFSRKPEGGASPGTQMRLSSYFLSPECTLGTNQSCYWAVFDYPDQGNLTARLQARCKSCPRPGQGCWASVPGAAPIPQQWEVLTTANQWVPSPAMQASCCVFKPAVR